jgi:hypothetical protein
MCFEGLRFGAASTRAGPRARSTRLAQQTDRGAARVNPRLTAQESVTLQKRHVRI